MRNHQNYLQRCLQLASLGQPWVAPNPMVGAVVVYNDYIVGEGYHEKFGQAHAEVNAINAVKDKSILSKSTLYVNLEPCSHYGKTPPCVNHIIESKIPKVVVSCLDPNPKVAGQGVATLRKAGIRVETGVLEQESLNLNKRFVKFFLHKKPYITLKWAQSKDGFMARKKGSSLSGKITYALHDRMVHRLRSSEMAILVGFNTALNDNPKLTNRYWLGNNPIRIVIDENGKLPNSLHVFQENNPTIILTHQPKPNTNTVRYVKLPEKKSFPEAVLDLLYQNEIHSVLIEGGAKTLELFLKENTWDEAHVFTADELWYDGLKAPMIRDGFEIFSEEHIKSTYRIYKPLHAI